MKNAFIALIVIVLSCLYSSAQDVIKVEVQLDENGYQLIRDGKPYYVKGVGGHKQMKVAKKIGANSIRTWGIENAKEILDEAHENGLTVMMGLWVQHERHGFDYNNQDAVDAQTEQFRKAVLEIKDHPALLFWGVGNEVDLNYKNTKVWHAIEDIASMIKELDPNHPTSTVTAGLDKEEVRLVMERCPSIDIYCINTYGDIQYVTENVKKFGWEGPYMITEWGPNGHWETPTTSWNAPMEQSSSEKAVTYKERYENFIAPYAERCIGSYVFLWGQKQEKTSTWYGMFSRDGKASEGINVLHHFWNENPPENEAPRIQPLTINDQTAPQNVMLEFDQLCEAEVLVDDPDGDRLKFYWEITAESLRPSVGGDAEANINSIPGLIKKRSNERIKFRAPKEEGAYRLFVYVYDRNGHFATSNVPFYVKPSASGEQSRFVQMKKQKLEIPEPN